MITKYQNIISRHEVSVFGNLKTTIRKSTSTFRIVRGKRLRWKDLKGL